MSIAQALEEARNGLKKSKDQDGIPIWYLEGPLAKYRDRFEVRQAPGGYAVDDHRTNDSAFFRSLGEVAAWIDEMIAAKP